MLEIPLLRRLIIEGTRNKRGVEPNLFCHLCLLDGFFGAVAAGAAEEFHASVGLFGDNLKDALVLLGRKGGTFTRCAHWNQRVHAAFDLKIDKFAQRALIERAVFFERRYNRRSRSLKSFCLCHVFVF